VSFGGERLNAAVVEPPGNLQRTSYVESPRSITLAWQDNSNNESGFLIEWSADGGITWSEFGQAGADVTSFSGSLPGEQVLYLFRIQSTDGTDVSGYSNVISVEGTNPNTADTDGDGIKDGYEVSHGLNPYEDDSYEDLDGDRYPNIFEFVKGTNSNDALSFPLADFVVNPSGPVQGNVFATVQAALDQVTIDYQIVQIKSGVFQGVANTNLVFPSEHPILLMSESGARGTILDGGGTARGLTLSTSSVVDGITIRNAAAVHGAAVYISGGSPLLINNVFFNNQAQQSGGAVYQEAGNSLLVHSTLRNNLAGTGGSGIAVASGSFRAEKSILWDGGATTEVAVTEGASFEAVESIVKGGYSGNGNSSGDPLLQGDGHLMGSSPAVDSGGILQTALRDMDGETRPSGTTTDIGADEWVDSDGDQLPDWWELLQFGGLENLASGDPDGDGLGNLQEYQTGSDPKNYYSQGGRR